MVISLGLTVLSTNEKEHFEEFGYFSVFLIFILMGGGIS
jgi:hypothetical protein